MRMTCENCSAEMSRLYDVVERETMFVLWECACAHKVLERVPLDAKVAAAPLAVAEV